MYTEWHRGHDANQSTVRQAGVPEHGSHTPPYHPFAPTEFPTGRAGTVQFKPYGHPCLRHAPRKRRRPATESRPKTAISSGFPPSVLGLSSHRPVIHRLQPCLPVRLTGRRMLLGSSKHSVRSDPNNRLHSYSSLHQLRYLP